MASRATVLRGKITIGHGKARLDLDLHAGSPVGAREVPETLGPQALIMLLAGHWSRVRRI